MNTILLQGLERSEQNFVTKFNPVPYLACVVCGTSTYIYKLAMKQALERNFVTKFIEAPRLLHVHAQWITSNPVSGGAIGQSLKERFLSNLNKLFNKHCLERSKQNFVTKSNHALHLGWACTKLTCTCPHGDPLPGPRECCRSNYEGTFTIESYQAGQKAVAGNE